MRRQRDATRLRGEGDPQVLPNKAVAAPTNDAKVQSQSAEAQNPHDSSWSSLTCCGSHCVRGNSGWPKEVCTACETCALQTHSAMTVLKEGGAIGGTSELARLALTIRLCAWAQEDYVDPRSAAVYFALIDSAYRPHPHPRVRQLYPRCCLAWWSRDQAEADRVRKRGTESTKDEKDDVLSLLDSDCPLTKHKRGVFER